MNEILLKRIVEAVKKTACPQCAFYVGGTCYNDDDCKLFDDFVGLMTLALQNTWISVDEALPPKRKTTKEEELEQSIPVFVRDNEGNYTSAWYSFYSKHWFMGYGEAFLKQSIYSKITHWMPIPNLNGGEE